MELSLKQLVGNIRTQKIGTILSQEFRGANGEFRGYVVAIENQSNEIWDTSAIAVLPPGF